VVVVETNRDTAALAVSQWGLSTGHPAAPARTTLAAQVVALVPGSMQETPARRRAEASDLDVALESLDRNASHAITRHDAVVDG
jgi:hypothetical protein